MGTRILGSEAPLPKFQGTGILKNSLVEFLLTQCAKMPFPCKACTMDYHCARGSSEGLSTRALKMDLLDPDPQSGFNVVACELHMAHRLCALHYLTASRTVTQHSTQLGSGSRPCGGKVLFETGSLIRIGCGSKVPCGEPQ